MNLNKTFVIYCPNTYLYTYSFLSFIGIFFFCYRSHSLDERLLSCSDTVEVRQVRFHPGSPNDSHILVLTSDNTLRH